MNQKKLIILMTVFLVTVVLTACGSSSDQNNNTQSDNKSEETKSDASPENDSHDTSTENDSGDTDNNATQNGNEKSKDNKAKNALDDYSSEEIEYARIWLQLGDTQNIDELNAEHISAGEPLNPDDKTSLEYPEDVVQLTGSRLAEGSITYSSNGDGTIKLYNKIPGRWDGKNPAGEDTYKKILEDTTQEAIDTGDDEKIKELIEKLNIDPGSPEME